MKRFNHAFEFAFEVVSEIEDGNEIAAEDLRTALLERVNRLTNEQLLDACHPYDTFQIIETETQED